MLTERVKEVLEFFLVAMDWETDILVTDKERLRHAGPLHAV